MIAIAGLLLAGVIFLAIELVVPGGILGIFGGVLMLIGVVVTFIQYGSTAGILTTLGALLAIGVTFYIEFKLLPHSRLARAFSMSETVGGAAPSALVVPENAVGRDCLAATRLAPSGYVLLDGRRFEAFSRDGVVNPGARVRIAAVDNFRLIVTQSQTTS